MKVVLNTEECRTIEWLINISVPKLTNSNIVFNCVGILDKIYVASPRENDDDRMFLQVLAELKKSVYKQLSK
jgi:hypothetical protein